MEHKKLVQILQQCRPNGGWVIQGDVVSYDEGVQPLTDDELKAGEDLVDSLKYRELRAKEYPSLADQLDAIWKGGDAAETMKSQVMAVKNKYPKPE